MRWDHTSNLAKSASQKVQKISSPSTDLKNAQKSNSDLKYGLVLINLFLTCWMTSRTCIRKISILSWLRSELTHLFTIEIRSKRTGHTSSVISFVPLPASLDHPSSSSARSHPFKFEIRTNPLLQSWDHNKSVPNFFPLPAIFDKPTH